MTESLSRTADRNALSAGNRTSRTVLPRTPKLCPLLSTSGWVVEHIHTHTDQSLAAHCASPQPSRKKKRPFCYDLPSTPPFTHPSSSHNDNDKNRPRVGGWRGEARETFPLALFGDSESYESDPSCGNHYILVYKHAAPIAFVSVARVNLIQGWPPGYGQAQWA